MRGDLVGKYQEVVQLTRQSAKAPSPAQSFAKLLGDIAPDRSQISETTQQKAGVGAGRGSSLEPRFEPLAMLRPGALEPTPPPSHPITEAIEIVNEAAPSVKTPTMLSAKRVQTRTRVVSEGEINRIQGMVQDAGRRHGIDPALSMGVIAAESGFDAQAVSQDGHASKGLFQLLDRTGLHLHGKLGSSDAYDPFNISQNVDLGVSYLRHLHELFSTERELPNGLKTAAAANSASLEKLAVAAFNAGEGRVASAQARASAQGADPRDYAQVEQYLPKTTQEYVERVLRSRSVFDAERVGEG